GVGDRALPFRRHEQRVRGDAGVALYKAARPGDPNLLRALMRPQPDGDRPLQRREKTGAAPRPVRLLRAARHDLDLRAVTVAVRLLPDELETKPPVAVSAVVAQQTRLPVHRDDQHIQVAVAVYVRVGTAARDQSFCQVALPQGDLVEAQRPG